MKMTFLIPLNKMISPVFSSKLLASFEDNQFNYSGTTVILNDRYQKNL